MINFPPMTPSTPFPPMTPSTPFPSMIPLTIFDGLESLKKNSNNETPQTNQFVATGNQPTVNDLQANSSIDSFLNYSAHHQTNQFVATAGNHPTVNDQQAIVIATDTQTWTGIEHIDDLSFKMRIDTFFQMMPESDVKAMDQALNNHGTKTGGKRITVLEHVREVFLGQFGGFGLSTDVLGASEEQQKICRAALRIAAFLHDIGKFEGQKNNFATHKADTVWIATNQLTKSYAAYGLDSATACLAIALIRHHNFIGDFTHPNPTKARSLQQIQTELQQAYQGLPKTSVTFEMFCQMLSKLYVANASTLSEVQKVGEIYKRFVVENKEFNNFHWLVNFKEALQKVLTTQTPQQPLQQQVTQRRIQQIQAPQVNPIQVPMPPLTRQQQMTQRQIQQIQAPQVIPIQAPMPPLLTLQQQMTQRQIQQIQAPQVIPIQVPMPPLLTLQQQNTQWQPPQTQPQPIPMQPVTLEQLKSQRPEQQMLQTFPSPPLSEKTSGDRGPMDIEKTQEKTSSRKKKRNRKKLKTSFIPGDAAPWT